MLSDYQPVAFVHTTDVARARRFYVDVLGLERVEETPFALVVRSAGTTIRVTPVDGFVASVATVLGWQVPDLDGVLAELVARHVTPLRFDGLEQDANGVWRSPDGARVAWFSDPDGNTLSLTQH